MKNSIEASIKHIEQINNSARIILTVSPIRHLRSGVTESSRSKAVLLSAIQELVDINDMLSYFPSYEIFMDELRDYRFAKEDLTHPTPMAEQYIWDRFCETYFTDSTNSILKEVNRYIDFKNHRPKNTDLHQSQIDSKKNKLKQQYPFINLQ